MRAEASGEISLAVRPPDPPQVLLIRQWLSGMACRSCPAWHLRGHSNQYRRRRNGRGESGCLKSRRRVKTSPDDLPDCGRISRRAVEYHKLRVFVLDWGTYAEKHPSDPTSCFRRPITAVMSLNRDQFRVDS